MRSRSISLPHVQAGDVHGTVGLILVLLIVGAPLVPAVFVTPAVALKATRAARGVVAF